ncbi:MAG: SDR family NAD(P)-dependent oxidoreductase [Nitrospinota bacterium]|jgi:3-oxoacyl-[acyl-carrier protein] reductase|nr:SDR family NAD(P)-dependent oxidoreductase [Nitrospinota bacterium]MDP7371231.1 SDR family NAD(P)-dependent oxidoreductase [Nitrospinota bacterium]MDP7503186.1 SDR family NAD(P)-dependent oxidoreductase [Nitrospinota bacterium]MDP7664091.1 SDR family NAD(P)-dependent oxidoreductase [Nitrospinota bacterium]
MDSLKDKIALVTGASRGIGWACAVALGQEGAVIAVNYRERENEAAESCRLIEAAGGRTFPVRADVSKAAEVAALLKKIAVDAGPVSVLVNNAGVSTKRSLDDATEADFDEAVTVNLKSAFLLTQAALPAMRETGWGRIVNISSNAAFTGGGTGPHYAASKAGMTGLTHAYAALLAGEGITVNAVAPGVIETEMIANRYSTPRAPVGRFGRAEEVAGAVVMFVRTSYITGQTLVISGGMYLN